MSRSLQFDIIAAMGITVVELTIKNPHAPSRSRKRHFLVDSFVPFIIVPRSIVQYLCLKASRTEEVVLANGSVVTRQLGEALIGLNDLELALPVVLGEKEDDALFSVIALESFGRLG